MFKSISIISNLLLTKKNHLFQLKKIYWFLKRISFDSWTLTFLDFSFLSGTAPSRNFLFFWLMLLDEKCLLHIMEFFFGAGPKGSRRHFFCQQTPTISHTLSWSGSEIWKKNLFLCKLNCFYSFLPNEYRIFVFAVHNYCTVKFCKQKQKPWGQLINSKH